jgi:hypothetical protein
MSLALVWGRPALHSSRLRISRFTWVAGLILVREPISLGEVRGPTIWGKENSTPGTSGRQGNLLLGWSVARVPGLNRIEGTGRLC